MIQYHFGREVVLLQNKIMAYMINTKWPRGFKYDYVYVSLFFKIKLFYT